MPKDKKQTQKKEEENSNFSNDDQKEDHGEIFMSWDFPEHPQHEYTKAWKIWMGILGGGLLLYSLFSGSWLFTVIIVMIVLISFLHARFKGENIDFSITEDGLKFGGRFYSYRDIKVFWIAYDPPELKTLYFEFKSSWRPDLRIPLEEQNPLKIRDILLKYLDEDLEKDDEPFSDALGRILKL